MTMGISWISDRGRPRRLLGLDPFILGKLLAGASASQGLMSGYLWLTEQSLSAGGLYASAAATAFAAGALVSSARRLRSAACCGLLSLALPGTGPLVIAFGIAPIIGQKPKPARPTLLRLNPVHKKPLHGNLHGQGQEAPNAAPHAADIADDPLATVGALRPLPAKYAVPQLRRHLQSSREDVRLLAYALLERTERDLRRQIDSILAVFKTASDAERAQPDIRSAQALAQLHYELVDTGLLADAAREQALTEASHWARHALAQLPAHSPTWQLLAQIELGRNRPAAALQCLRHAQRYGADAATIIELRHQARLQWRTQQGPALPLQAPSQVPAGGQPLLQPLALRNRRSTPPHFHGAPR